VLFKRASLHEGVLGEWKYSSTHSFTSALGGGEWSTSGPGRFIPRERVPRTHWPGGCAGLRAGMDKVVKRKIPSPRWESNPDYPARNLVAIPTELSRLLIDQRLFSKFLFQQHPLCIYYVYWFLRFKHCLLSTVTQLLAVPLKSVLVSSITIRRDLVINKVLIAIFLQKLFEQLCIHPFSC
jgi:hypothetical protein